MKTLHVGSIVKCDHGGTLTIPAGSGKLRTDGSELLTTRMIESATISGCAQSAAGGVNCTRVIPGSISSGICGKLTIQNMRCVTDQLVFQTNGSPGNTGSALPELSSKIESS